MYFFKYIKIFKIEKIRSPSHTLFFSNNKPYIEPLIIVICKSEYIFLQKIILKLKQIKNFEGFYSGRAKNVLVTYL